MVVALHVSYVQKFGLDVLEVAFMTSENTQQPAQFEPPRRIVRVGKW